MPAVVNSAWLLIFTTNPTIHNICFLGKFIVETHLTIYSVWPNNILWVEMAMNGGTIIRYLFYGGDNKRRR